MNQKNGELKVVIALREGKASVGVQAPECDPAFFMHKGDLTTVLGAIPGDVDKAKKRWEKDKLNPKWEGPLPSQEKPPAPAAAASSSGSRTKPASQDQPLMF